MKLLIYPLCLILISFATYTKGTNPFLSLGLREFRGIPVCLARNGTHAAANDYRNCQGPRFGEKVDTLFKYCVRQYFPNATSLYEMLQQIGENYCVIDKIYYCVLEELDCITCSEKYIGMANYEKCVRAVRDRYCPKGVHPYPECKDDDVVPVPGSNNTCCSGDCYYEEKVF